MDHPRFSLPQILCLLALWFGLAGSACTHSPATQAPQTQDCAITIETSLSNGRLLCGATLSTEHQHDLLLSAMANHEITCQQERDTIKLRDLVFDFAPDGRGGWRRSATSCTMQYMQQRPIARALSDEYASRIEAILRQPGYCDLGNSCDQDCGCDESCCMDEDCCLTRGLPCTQRIATGGVIIAVVSSLPQQ